MNRLTKRQGNRVILPIERHAMNPDAIEIPYQKALQKLAAYEDTGLEPEEIKEAVELFEPFQEADIPKEIKSWVERCTWHVKKCNEISGQLKKYMDAEEEGRLVILPCKVGDTVYLIRNNTSARKSCPDFSHFYGMDATCCINDIYYPEIEESPICEKQFFEIAKYTPSEYWIFEHRKKFGKTVFMTREEAEAALDKMKGEQRG